MSGTIPENFSDEFVVIGSTYVPPAVLDVCLPNQPAEEKMLGFAPVFGFYATGFSKSGVLVDESINQ